MAWTSGHFAVGMACGGAVALGAMLIRRRWQGDSASPVRWLVPAMTLGGVWACIPDLPRVWRSYPSLPLSTSLGSAELEQWLHRFGDLFFLHRLLDRQPHELAVVGLAAIIFLYNLGWVMQTLLVGGWRVIRARRRPPCPVSKAYSTARQRA